MASLSLEALLQLIRSAITSNANNEISGQILRELLVRFAEQAGFLIRTYAHNDDLQVGRYQYRAGEYVEYEGSIYYSFTSGTLEPPSETNSIPLGTRLITERADEDSTILWVQIARNSFSIGSATTTTINSGATRRYSAPFSVNGIDQTLTFDVPIVTSTGGGGGTTEMIEVFTFDTTTRDLRIKLTGQDAITINIPAPAIQADKYLQNVSLNNRVLRFVFNDATPDITITIPDDIYVNDVSFNNNTLRIGRQGADALTQAIPFTLSQSGDRNNLVLSINGTDPLPLQEATNNRTGVLTGQDYETFTLANQRSIDAGKFRIYVGESINSLVDGGTSRAHIETFFANPNTRVIEGRDIVVEADGEKRIDTQLIDSVSTTQHYYVVAASHDIEVEQFQLNNQVIPLRNAGIIGQDRTGHTRVIFQSLQTYNVNTGGARAVRVDIRDLQGVGIALANALASITANTASITTAEGNITANASAITAAQASITTNADNIAANATAIAGKTALTDPVTGVNYGSLRLESTHFAVVNGGLITTSQEPPSGGAVTGYVESLGLVLSVAAIQRDPDESSGSFRNNQERLITSFTVMTGSSSDLFRNVVGTNGKAYIEVLDTVDVNLQFPLIVFTGTTNKNMLWGARFYTPPDLANPIQFRSVSQILRAPEDSNEERGFQVFSDYRVAAGTYIELYLNVLSGVTRITQLSAWFYARRASLMMMSSQSSQSNAAATWFPSPGFLDKVLTFVENQEDIQNRASLSEDYVPLPAATGTANMFRPFPLVNAFTGAAFTGTEAVRYFHPHGVPPRELIIFKITVPDFTNERVIFNGGTTKLSIRANTGELEVQWGEIERFQDLLIQANTETIIAFYAETLTDSTTNIRISISTHGATVQRAISSIPSARPDAERVWGNVSNSSSTAAGLIGNVRDVYMGCPENPLTLDDVLQLSRSSHIPVRTNLYGLVALGQNADGSTAILSPAAFGPNLLGAPSLVRGGSERVAITSVNFPLNWRDMTDLRVIYAITSPTDRDPPYDRRLAVDFAIRHIEVMDLSNSQMATDFVNVTNQYNRFTMHVGVSSSGLVIKAIGTANDTILAHVHMLLGSSLGVVDGLLTPDAFAVGAAAAEIEPYNAVIGLYLR